MSVTPQNDLDRGSSAYQAEVSLLRARQRPGDPVNTAERYRYSTVASLVLQKGKVLLKGRNL